MDEYLYVSDRKIRQHLPAASDSWWRRLRAKKLTAGVDLGYVRTEVEVEQRDLEHLTDTQLAKVVARIDEHCPWYEEPLAAGGWAFFEGRLGAHVATEGPAAGGVLFYDVAPSNGARRVLLHGSATHLRDRPPAPAGMGGADKSGARPAHGFSAEDGFRLVVRSADEAMAARTDHGLLPGLLGGLRRRRPSAGLDDELAGHVAALFRTVDSSHWYTDTAPYVAAVVKVTTVLRASGASPETLVGSPLFVRSVRP